MRHCVAIWLPVAHFIWRCWLIGKERTPRRFPSSPDVDPGKSLGKNLEVGPVAGYGVLWLNGPTDMNIEVLSTNGKCRCSPAQALAMKNAALKAVLGYLEQKQVVGEWSHEAHRFHRLVELALEVHCDLGDEEQPRFQIQDL